MKAGSKQIAPLRRSDLDVLESAYPLFLPLRARVSPSVPANPSWRSGTFEESKSDELH